MPVGDDVTVLYHLSDGTYEVKKDGKVFLKRPIGASSAAVSADAKIGKGAGVRVCVWTTV